MKSITLSTASTPSWTAQGNDESETWGAWSTQSGPLNGLIESVSKLVRSSAPKTTCGRQRRTHPVGSSLSAPLRQVLCLVLIFLSVWAPQALGSDVRTFGAIGDGRSHPACATLKLRSLDELRRHRGGLYRFASSCSHEMDWLGAQAAIHAAEAAGGDLVTYPTGTFLHDATLTLPEASHSGSGPFRAGVSLRGQGMQATSLVWPRDLGLGQFAIECANRSSTQWGCAGFLEDLRIVGPSFTGEMGKLPAEMDGLGWGARRQMQRIGISGFRSCLVIAGDQTRIADLYLRNCYYGIYWDRPNPILFGDMMFERIIIDHSSMAGLAVSPDAMIGQTTFISSTIGGAPYGIYKETGGRTDTAVHGVEFLTMQFENIGNALLADDRTPDSRKAVAYNTRFVRPQFLWNPAFKLNGSEAAAIFDARRFYLVTLDGLREPASWQPGTRGVFNVDIPHDSEIRGDLDTLLRLCEAAERPLATMRDGGTLSFRVQQTGGWSGFILGSHNGVPISAGDLVAAEGAEFRPSTGRPGESIWGIATAPTRGSDSNSAFVLATRGVVAGRVAAEAPQPGSVLIPGPGGAAALGTPQQTQSRIGFLARTEGAVNMIRLQGLD